MMMPEEEKLARKRAIEAMDHFEPGDYLLDSDVDDDSDFYIDWRKDSCIRFLLI